MFCKRGRETFQGVEDHDRRDDVGEFEYAACQPNRICGVVTNRFLQAFVATRPGAMDGLAGAVNGLENHDCVVPLAKSHTLKPIA